MLATSCNKNKDTNSTVYRVAMDPQETSFEREDGYYEGANDRIYIDNTYRVKFEQGDQVMLFNVDEANPSVNVCAMYTVAATGYEANLQPVGQAIPDEISESRAKYAFYPGQNVETPTLTTDSRGIFTLDETQTYRVVDGAPVVAHDALYMAAKIDNPANDQFAFRNICGILEMKFFSTAGKTVTSIEITDPERNLTGDVSLIIPEVDPGTMTSLFRNYVADPTDEATIGEIAGYKQTVGYAVTNAGNTLTLNCGNGVQLGTTRETATTFYFVLRPLALMDGFTAHITFSDDTTKDITSTAYNRNTIKPNTFRVFPALKVD